MNTSFYQTKDRKITAVIVCVSKLSTFQILTLYLGTIGVINTGAGVKTRLENKKDTDFQRGLV